MNMLIVEAESVAKRKELLRSLIVYYAHTCAWKQQMSLS